MITASHATARQHLATAQRANVWMWVLLVAIIALMTIGTSICWPPGKSSQEPASTSRVEV